MDQWAERGTGLLEQIGRTERSFRLEGDKRWLATGDLGFVRDGEVFVTSRLKDIIFVHGRNLYPQDIEYSVCTADSRLARSACAAFAVEGDGCEHLVVVQEVTREGLRADDWTSTFTAIRQTLASTHEVAAARIVLIKPSALPRTTSGKVRQSATRAALMNGQLPIVAEWAGLTEQQSQSQNHVPMDGKDLHEPC